MNNVFLLRITDGRDQDGLSVAYAEGYRLERSHYVGTKPEAMFFLTGVQLLDETWLHGLVLADANMSLSFETIRYRITSIERSMSLVSSATWISAITATHWPSDQIGTKAVFHVEVLPELIELGLDGKAIGLRTKRIYE